MRTSPHGLAGRWTMLACAPLAVACTASQTARPTTPSPQDSVPSAYGSAPRNRSSDALVTLTSRDIDAMRASRVSQLLQGRVAGAYVIRNELGDYEIRIRGASSFVGGGGQPLYVVDGMPVRGRGLGNVLDGIPPLDIARIDVLKDAGATAVYGIAGANGVILITTKRARTSTGP